MNLNLKIPSPGQDSSFPWLNEQFGWQKWNRRFLLVLGYLQAFYLPPPWPYHQRIGKDLANMVSGICLYTMYSRLRVSSRTLRSSDVTRGWWLVNISMVITWTSTSCNKCWFSVHALQHQYDNFLSSVDLRVRPQFSRLIPQIEESNFYSIQPESQSSVCFQCILKAMTNGNYQHSETSYYPLSSITRSWSVAQVMSFLDACLFGAVLYFSKWLLDLRRSSLCPDSFALVVVMCRNGNRAHNTPTQRSPQKKIVRSHLTKS